MSKYYRLFFLVVLLLSANYVSAQTDKEKAKKMGDDAINLEDNGNFGGALKILQDAEKLDPENMVYPYEKAYSYYSLKEYQKAIDILVKLTAHKDRIARVYQLLGNSYDNSGQTQKAIETYDAGLKVFPNSGELYLESSVIQLGKKDYNKALAYNEQGIKADPKFPSNYYWASRLLCSSKDKYLGLIYGEIFMNLERNTKRTREISKLVFDTYKSSVKFTAPGKISVDLSNDVIALSDPKKFKIPFGIAYGLDFTICLAGDTVINQASLNGIRQRFVENYFSKGRDKEYPNVLLSYEKKVLDAGQMAAYNYWILMEGNDDEFIKWRDVNKQKWDDFSAWFAANRIDVDVTGAK